MTQSTTRLPYSSAACSIEVLGVDLAAAKCACASCGAAGFFADAVVYTRGPGRVAPRSRQPLGDDRLRRGVDQVVEQGAVARDRDTVDPPLDEEVVQPFSVAFDDDVGVVDRACVCDAVDE
jgi:hypothetical protein